MRTEDFITQQLESGKEAIEAPYVRGLLRRVNHLVRVEAEQKRANEALAVDLREAEAETARLRGLVSALKGPLDTTLGECFAGGQYQPIGLDPSEFLPLSNEVLYIVDQLRLAASSLKQTPGYISTWAKFTHFKGEAGQELSGLAVLIFLDTSYFDKEKFEILGPALDFSRAASKAGLRLPIHVSPASVATEGLVLERGYFRISA